MLLSKLLEGMAGRDCPSGSIAGGMARCAVERAIPLDDLAGTAPARSDPLFRDLSPAIFLHAAHAPHEYLCFLVAYFGLRIPGGPETQDLIQ